MLFFENLGKSEIPEPKPEFAGSVFSELISGNNFHYPNYPTRKNRVTRMPSLSQRHASGVLFGTSLTILGMRAAAIFEFKVTQLMGVEEHRVAVSLRTLNKDCE